MRRFTLTPELTEKEFFEHFPDLSEIDDPGEAARKAYEYIRQSAVACDMDPDIETFIAKPDEREESGGNWWVVWEAGFYDWGLNLSFDKRVSSKRGKWFCECYWGFDLIFVSDA